MMIEKKKLHSLIGLVVVVVILGSLVAISYREENKGTVMSGNYFDYEADKISFQRSASAPAGIISPVPSPELLTQTDALVEQKIIKNGSLDLEVENIEQSLKDITRITEAASGFVSQAYAGQSGDERRYGSATLRVPATAFSKTLDELKSLALVVNNESISSNDVTEQFIDLSARLNNAKAQEQAYLEVLARAVTVDEILRVQQALAQVRGEIESLQGRIQFLENQADLSTISVSLSEESSVSLPSKTFRPISTIKDAAKALVAIGQEFVSGVIWFVIVGGGILVPLALLVLVVRFFMKRKS